MKITTVGIDLAKNVFQLHAVDERGHHVIGRWPASLCHTNEKILPRVTGSTLDLATRSRTPGMARAIA
jgi:hypothetical protein